MFLLPELKLSTMGWITGSNYHFSMNILWFFGRIHLKSILIVFWTQNDTLKFYHEYLIIFGRINLKNHCTSTLETKMIGQGDTLKDHIQIMLWNKIWMHWKEWEGIYSCEMSERDYLHQDKSLFWVRSMSVSLQRGSSILYCSCIWSCLIIVNGGRRGCDHVVVGFSTTYTCN